MKKKTNKVIKKNTELDFYPKNMFAFIIDSVYIYTVHQSYKVQIAIIK